MNTQHFFELESDTHPGQMIRGTTYLPPREGKFPTLVMLHGFTGNRGEAMGFFVQMARQLAAEGIACITFDFRHSGESHGSFDQMLVPGEVDDALTVTKWARKQPFVDNDRMGLLGFSLGGMVAACTVGRVDTYKALVLMAPTTPENMKAKFKTQIDTKQPVTVGAYEMRPDFVDQIMTLNPVMDVVKHPRPTMVIQGDKDSVVMPEVSQHFVDAMLGQGQSVDHVMIEGAEHVFGTAAQRRTLMLHLIEFLVDEL